MNFFVVAVAGVTLAALINLFKRRTRCSFVVKPETGARFTAHPLPCNVDKADAILLSSTALSHAHVVGLDCEWQPERFREHNPVALLQLAAGTECFLAPLLHMGIPPQMTYVLQDPLVIKVHCFPLQSTAMLTGSTDHVQTMP